MRLLLRAERGNRAGHRLGVGAFVDGDDLVVLLGLVEALGQRIQRFAELAAHGVPPLNFGLGRRQWRFHRTSVLPPQRRRATIYARSF